MAHWTAGLLLLGRGDWALARPRIEHGIPRSGRPSAVLALPWAVAGAAWALGQLGAGAALGHLREGEELVEDLAAREIVGTIGLRYYVLGRASLLLGRFDEARRLADRALESSPTSAELRRPCLAPARRPRDPS